MSLADNIHQLTSEHLRRDDAGAYVKSPPLLAELRAASGSTLGAAGGGKGGAGMVVNSKAVELETAIKEQALAEHFEMTGTEYRGGLVNLIKSWAVITSTEWIAYLERVTTDWVADIQAVLEAAHPPWRPSIPCPACGQRFHGPEREPCLAVTYWDADADTIAPPSAWSAACIGCGAQWTGDELRWLRAAADTPQPQHSTIG
jgi:hypothetical protein